MLARERRKIINRMQEKQEKLIVAMKKDLKNEIQRGIVAYKVRRSVVIGYLDDKTVRLPRHNVYRSLERNG